MVKLAFGELPDSKECQPSRMKQTLGAATPNLCDAPRTGCSSLVADGLSRVASGSSRSMRGRRGDTPKAGHVTVGVSERGKGKEAPAVTLPAVILYAEVSARRDDTGAAEQEAAQQQRQRPKCRHPHRHRIGADNSSNVSSGSIGGHRGILFEPKVAGPSMLQIGCPDRHPLQLTTCLCRTGADEAPSRESGFVLRRNVAVSWRTGEGQKSTRLSHRVSHSRRTKSVPR